MAQSLRDDMDLINLSIIRQSFAQTVFTHQVQEIAAANKRKKVLFVKIANLIMVSAVLVLFAIQSQTPDELIYSYIGAGLTVAEIIFLLIQLNFNFEAQSLLHKNSALKYMALRDRYRLLIADVMNSRSSKKELLIRRDNLQHEYQSISDLSPNTGKSEFDSAQLALNKEGIVKGEQYTWSDEEIDHFLPEELRLVHNKRRN